MHLICSQASQSCRDYVCSCMTACSRMVAFGLSDPRTHSCHLKKGVLVRAVPQVGMQRDGGIRSPSSQINLQSKKGILVGPVPQAGMQQSVSLPPIPTCHLKRGLFVRAVPQAGQVRYEAHLLDAAASPLVAALPQYERGFRDHHAAGRAYLDAIHVRATFLPVHLLEMSCGVGWVLKAAFIGSWHATYFTLADPGGLYLSMPVPLPSVLTMHAKKFCF